MTARDSRPMAMATLAPMGKPAAAPGPPLPDVELATSPARVLTTLATSPTALATPFTTLRKEGIITSSITDTTR